MTEVLNLLNAQGFGTQYVVVVVFASVLALLSRNGLCGGIVGVCSVVSVAFEPSIHQGLLAYFAIMVLLLSVAGYQEINKPKEKPTTNLLS